MAVPEQWQTMCGLAPSSQKPLGHTSAISGWNVIQLDLKSVCFKTSNVIVIDPESLHHIRWGGRGWVRNTRAQHLNQYGCINLVPSSASPIAVKYTSHAVNLHHLACSSGSPSTSPALQAFARRCQPSPHTMEWERLGEKLKCISPLSMRMHHPGVLMCPPIAAKCRQAIQSMLTVIACSSGSL
eukprot:322561-Chlamydomonas_euryale.AAC.20